jgi:hypothetical protein
MGKSCTDDLRALDVRRLARDGLLQPGRSFAWSWMRNGATVATINITPGSYSVTLDYRHKPHGREWQDKSYPVRLAHSACNMGGQRAWWLCPASGCGRRAALLYLGSSGVFACRHCYRLAYRSQMETAHDRTFRRANNLRTRLGWVAGIAHSPGDKPKGMHWRTYSRLMESYQNQANQVLTGSMAAVERMRGRLDRMGL